MKFNGKKGQAALEFLMTYGWAIMVVLAAIGALAYFGVLNPSNFLPDRCVASTGFACLGTPRLDGTNNDVAFTISNGLGRDVDIPMAGITTTPATGAGLTCTELWVCGKGIPLNPLAPDSSCVDSLTTAVTLTDGGEYTVHSVCAINGLNNFKIRYAFTYNNPTSGLDEDGYFDVSGKVRK